MSKPSKSKGNAASADKAEAAGPKPAASSAPELEGLAVDVEEQPVEEEKQPDTQPAPVKAEKAAAPAPKHKPNDLIVCKVHRGQYLADKTYNEGDEVLVQHCELEKLAHCLSPSEE